MAVRFVVVLLSLVFAAGCATPQTSSPSTAPAGRLETVRSDLRSAGRTLAGTVRELPPRTPAEWTYLGALAGVSAVLENRKEEIRRQVLRSSAFRHSHWTEIGGQLGLSRNAEIAAAGLYVTGLATGLPRTRETGLLLGESLLAAQAGTGVLNFVFSEARPERGGRLRYFHSGGSSASIHMTNTMAVARVFDYEIAASGWTGPGATLARVGVYAIPAVTGWERLRSDQHYLWNVVLGGGASFYITSALLRAHERQAERAGKARIAVLPLAPSGPKTHRPARGLTVSCSF
jgi:hypothetical protein